MIISIIIPVYNAQDTIGRCLERICSEKDIEIICVDDGSQDSSPDILDSWHESHPNIRVIHQQNAGAGAARNRGLKEASGDYIMFCDADDTYDIDTITKIKSDIKLFNPDYLVFHRKTVFEDGHVQDWGACCDVRRIETTWYDYLNSEILPRRHGMGVTTKCFKRELIHQHKISFAQELTFGEDLWFLLCYLPWAEVLIEDYSTNYIQYQTNGSICMRQYDDFIGLNMQCIDTYAKLYPTSYSKIESFASQYCLSVVSRALARIYEQFSFKSLVELNANYSKIVNNMSVRRYLLSVFENDSLSENEKNIAQLLCREKYFQHWAGCYFIPSIKQKLKKIICKR